MTTEASRRASRNYHLRREAMGLKKVTVWLDEDARDTLDALAILHGSKDAAVREAIKRLGSARQPPDRQGRD